VGDRADAPEAVAAAWQKIVDRSTEFVPESGEGQGRLELQSAGYSRPAPGAI
jgi:hypothetical protein